MKLVRNGIEGATMTITIDYGHNEPSETIRNVYQIAPSNDGREDRIIISYVRDNEACTLKIMYTEYVIITIH